MQNIIPSPRPRAEVIYSPRLAKRIARTIIDHAKEKGAAHVQNIASALGGTPDLDRLVAKEIGIYKRFSKRKRLQ